MGRELAAKGKGSFYASSLFSKQKAELRVLPQVRTPAGVSPPPLSIAESAASKVRVCHTCLGFGQSHNAADVSNVGISMHWRASVHGDGVQCCVQAEPKHGTAVGMQAWC